MAAGLGSCSPGRVAERGTLAVLAVELAEGTAAVLPAARTVYSKPPVASGVARMLGTGLCR